MPGTLRTDVLVVGGGPAGLSAAAACRARRCDYLLIEAGNRVGLRDHNVQRSLGSGVGGSGLYSDGKFSFFPSASALWSLRDHRALEESWRWFASLVAGFDVEADTLPDLAALPAIPLINGAGSNPFDRKEYRSAYMSYAARRRLIEALEAGCGQALIAVNELHSLRYESENLLFRCDVRGEDESGPDRIDARAMILAGGRFGPLGWPAASPASGQVFRRVEVGVRLEQASEEFFLQEDQFLDPKLIRTSSDSRYGWRTFCCCRDGEVITTEVRGLVSVSGRADCPPTGRSNVGFNLRVTDAELARSLWPLGIGPNGGRVEQPLDEYLEGDGREIAGVLGAGPSRLLAEGVVKLRDAYPALRNAQVVAPAIEGVGFYPELSDNLRSGSNPLWIAGDGTGIFRGLTAAMVSGYFAALQVAGYLEASAWT